MSNDENKINVKKYLVTQSSDIKSFSKKKILTDLSTIQKAEIRSKKSFDITSDKRASEVTRAMDALKLLNPFKGF